MDDYSKYTALDFAQDEQFIRWVKDGQKENSDFGHWLKDNPHKMDEVLEATRFVQNIKFQAKKVSNDRIEAIWVKIDEKTSEPSSVVSPKRMRRRILTYISAAAAVVLLLIAFFIWPSHTISIRTAYAQKTEHTLPDGSIIYLNAGSQIKYNEKKWASDRIVKLTGEAFFEVVKGSKFEVHTNLGSVRVLGTSFNVKAREKLEVACLTGRVEVTIRGAESTILTPGKSAVTSALNKSLDLSTFSPGQWNYWRTGTIHYEATSLKQIFEDLERQFDVRIRISEINAKRSFTGNVTFNNITESLNLICPSMNLAFVGNGKNYQIIEK